VAEADADDADAVLGEEFLDESDEVVYPGGGFEGGVFWEGRWVSLGLRLWRQLIVSCFVR